MGRKSKKVKRHISKLNKLRGREAFKKARFSKANLTIFSIIFAAIGGYFIYSSFAATTNCSSISQYGITINFNKTYICGTFANGDYWVVPNAGDTGVVISSMSPAFSAGQNGWEVNPVYTGGQGFDTDMDNYDGSLVPALPYTATGNKSIVKTTTAAGGCPNNAGCLQSAIALTVLSSVPPNDGASIFRPPYVGSAKPLYTTTQLQTQLLPSLSVSGYTPPAISSINHAHRLQLDHKDGLLNRNMHPIDNMYDYGSQIAQDINDGVGRLMFNDSVSAKMPLLIDMVQGGMDRYYMTLQGQQWVAPGPGHNMGRKLSIAFATIMLNDATMKNNVQTNPNFANFHEDQGLFTGTKGDVLWGGWDEYIRTESEYWAYIAGGQSSNADIADPYGYIDGGTFNGSLDSYQFCCTSQPWKGSAMILHLIPSMQTIWQNQALIQSYTIRWVNSGAHYLPDPCAPTSQGGGPLPGSESPMQCKLDPDLTVGSTFTNFSCQAGKECGRFPSLNGSDPDGGWNRSDIIDHLWTAYGDTTPPPPPPPPAPDPTPPTVSMVAPTSGSTVSGPTVTLSANASDNVGVVGVQFKVDGNNTGTEDTLSPYSISWDSFTVSNGTHTITATARDAFGNSTTSATVSVTVSNTGNMTIGETTITPNDDSGNANILLAQQATLAQTATIQSMTFYVTTAAGKLRLGIYDATGPSGGPGAKKAETAEITPVVGWNTAGVTTPISLPAGSYWLAYLPSSGSLAFKKSDTSSTPSRYYAYPYGSLPTTYSTTPTTTPSHWSLYATFSLGGTTPPPPPPPAKVGDINNDNQVNITDLSLLLSSYGQNTTQCITNTALKCDLSSPGDGVVNIFDLSILLSKYGT